MKADLEKGWFAAGGRRPVTLFAFMPGAPGFDIGMSNYGIAGPSGFRYAFLMTAEEDYPRQLKACRIIGTLLLLVSGLSLLGMSLKISFHTSVFESMVEGGKESYPPITIFLIKFQFPLMSLMAFVLMGSLWGLWMARRVSTLIYIAGAVFAFFIVVSAMIELGMQQPLITYTRKFR